MKSIQRPCDECPFRKDAEPGRFDVERWGALEETVRTKEHPYRGGPTFGAPLFACHKTPDGGERGCAGWLAVEGANHPSVRLSVACGGLEPDRLSPKDGWPELHESFDEARDHDLNGRSIYYCPVDHCYFASETTEDIDYHVETTH